MADETYRRFALVRTPLDVPARALVADEVVKTCESLAAAASDALSDGETIFSPEQRRQIVLEAVHAQADSLLLALEERRMKRLGK